MLYCTWVANLRCFINAFDMASHESLRSEVKPAMRGICSCACLTGLCVSHRLCENHLGMFDGLMVGRRTLSAAPLHA